MWQRMAAVLVFVVLVGCAAPADRAADAPEAPAGAAVAASEAAEQSVPPNSTSLRPALTHAAESLDGERFSGLLHFEHDTDGLFVAADVPVPRVEAGEAHTGESSLLLAPNTQRLAVKLSSLLSGRAFPADWTLLGLYVRPGQAAGITLTCETDGRAIATRRMSLAAQKWSAAMLDLAALDEAPMGEMTLVLRFDQPAESARVDDVLLIDNRQTLVEEGPDGWTVTRAGLRITCERPQRFTFSVVSRYGSPQGWTLEEANALRACFRSEGETKRLTVYADGRSLWDGAYKPLSAEVREDPSFAAAHAAPADIAVPETMGRVQRSTSGDANNDGYNEMLGAYQLYASGGRMELTMTPRSAPIPRPVLQIAGLPPGKALITIEGRLVERSTRLEDGQLLVELPARITRPTLVSVRIQ